MSTILLSATELAAPPAPVTFDLHAEAARLFALGDRWLAQALLALSRAARRAAPALRPDDTRLDARLVWDIAPEIARRLGATRFLPLEAHADFARMSLGNLRLRLADCLAFTGQYRRSGTDWALLTLPAEQGNVVAFAMDRLGLSQAGTTDETRDPLCQRIVTACRLAQTPSSTRWFPGIELKPAPPLELHVRRPSKTVLPAFQTGFPE